MTTITRRIATVVVVATLAVAACGGGDDETGEPHPDVTVPRPPASVTAGGEIFAARCTSCHGANLRGGIGPSLASVGNGQPDAFYVDRVTNGKGGMPAFGDDLAEDEIRSVVDFIRSIQAAALEG